MARYVRRLGRWDDDCRTPRRRARGVLVFGDVGPPRHGPQVRTGPRSWHTRRYSKWFLSVVASFTAILLSFQKWLKAEQNYKAFRLGESSYYDLRRQILDRPLSFGDSEQVQLDAYFLQVEKLRRQVRDAEIDNFPSSNVPKVESSASTGGSE